VQTDLKILLKKAGTRLNLKIVLISLHIEPGEKIFSFYSKVGAFHQK
jgi:hypothetical protein